ncbi:glycoside hydrolase family 11 protein [Micromonospora sp. NBC_01813]|uniref:glycoside hydrolase family 11 protein n=1 Tax=Micromonospora sp. NBC_01813 TaxID=2975988 RepID=UPI002DD8033C|nr:glycoside hydrolase family 11 protein [Micromonospora sp. NBC_01813]WSA07844.1 glycoside hydrolase family 11 protein [Micromonospora sp. NBC_01813]
MRETPYARSARGRRGRIRLMVGVACTAILTLLATAPVTNAHAEPAQTRPVITANQTGTHDGYFYAYWKDMGDSTMTLGPQGSYSARWSGINNWFGGKGWATGGRRTFDYCGTLHPGGNSYLALYGYTTSPLAEYYVIENWGTYRPSGTPMGTVVSEGSTYDIYRAQLGVGSTPYYRYYSVRQQKRSAGTIDTGDHFDAWARAGMNLNATMGYMIMATEGYQSSGWSSVTVNPADTGPQRCAANPE